MAGGNGRCLIRSEICSHESFLELSSISQTLYFQLLLSADFEGFIGKIKTEFAMLSVKAKPKNLKELKESGYIIEFPSKVTLIVHWWKLNTWDERGSKRKQNQTLYQKEKAMVTLDEEGLYRLIANDLRMNCEGKETNIKENNEQTNPVRLVGLSDDSIYNSLSDKDRNSLEAECRKHKVRLQELIKAIDISVKSRKEQTDIKTPFRYIIQIAEAKNWNIDEINKSYHPVNNSPELPLKHYRDIEGSLWGNLDEKQRASMKAQYEGDDLTRLIKDIDTLVKANPGETYRGTEVSLFKKLADRILAEGR